MQAAGIIGGAVQAFLQAAQALAEELAGLGQGHPPGFASEERKSQFSFQQGDLPAEGGLGDVQDFGRRGETALVGNGKKVTNLAQAWHRNPA
ncbi:hypothetical protein AZSI13_12640 [Azospira sp. I13]|nr:hypothetical protein AZSI13_12640 [Azospira sp. I13]